MTSEEIIKKVVELGYSIKIEPSEAANYEFFVVMFKNNVRQSSCARFDVSLNLALQECFDYITRKSNDKVQS